MKLLLFFLWHSWALACGNLNIQQLHHIDFENNPNPAENLKIHRSGNDACDFFITVDNGGATSFSTRRLEHTSSSETLPVQICRDAVCSSPIKHIPEATSNNDVLVGSFPAGGDDDLSFTLYPRITGTSYQRFGRYEDNFSVRVYKGSLNGSRTLEDSDSFRLRQELSKKIDLSLVSVGQQFDPAATYRSVNFGTLTAGKQETFDLVLKFNAGYRVRVSSQNNGQLKHSSLPNTIAYSLSFDGNSVGLSGSASSPVLVAQGSGVSPSGGTRLGGVFTVGAVATGAQSGNYQDSITITVTTTE